MPNLTDEQKKLIIGKMDDLTVDLTDKFNLRELEKMAKIDEATLKSSIVANVVGNSFDLVKKLKRNERMAGANRL